MSAALRRLRPRRSAGGRSIKLGRQDRPADDDDLGQLAQRAAGLHRAVGGVRWHRADRLEDQKRAGRVPAPLTSAGLPFGSAAALGARVAVAGRDRRGEARLFRAEVVGEQGAHQLPAAAAPPAMCGASAAANSAAVW